MWALCAASLRSVSICHILWLTGNKHTDTHHAALYIKKLLVIYFFEKFILFIIDKFIEYVIKNIIGSCNSAPEEETPDSREEADTETENVWK